MRKIKKHYEQQEREHPFLHPVSMTHQSHQRECDINNIMAKWQKTGVIEHQSQYQGQYGDFTEMPGDFQEAQNQVLMAQEMFMTLPSSVRNRFHNDPGAFLDFANNPENGAEMVKLGLAAVREDDLVITEPETKQKASTAKKTEAESPQKSTEGDAKA